MTTISFHFDDQVLNHMTGPETINFLSDMLRNDPRFFVDAADHIDIRGPFGK